ncbi:hypothetical protein GOP47_0030146 [Adiantum capillus-veneris]|nr:hypothetical protein GOP47_0030146 [Adiantum capillus-veneris]
MQQTYNLCARMEWKPNMEQELGKADVVVRVYPRPSARTQEDPLLVLPLHSRVLSARSSFFAARLSQRWHSSSGRRTLDSKDNPADPAIDDAELFGIDIVAPCSSAVPTYKRCINLVYVQRKDMISCRHFSGVEDALHMLRIAAELLFEDCIDACMEYLDMLCSWTPDEEESIRSTLSTLQLAHIHPDLARRLSFPQAVPTDEPTIILRRMLVHALKASTTKAFDLHAFQAWITPKVKAIDPSKPIPESTILLAWNTHVDTIRTVVNFQLGYNYQDGDMAISRLLWLFDILVTLRAADSVVRVFAKDTGLSSSLTVFFNKGYDNLSLNGILGRKFESLLSCMLDSVVKGQVLLSQTDRLTLTRTWLPVCNTRSGLGTRMKSLIDSLPVVDREQFYKDCLDPNLQVSKIDRRRSLPYSVLSSGRLYSAKALGMK